MSNSPSKGTDLMAYTRFSLDRSTPLLWRVTFDNPPINLIDPVMIVALHELLTEIEQDNRVADVVFDSADPDFFLAHYDIAADQSAFDALPAAPTPFPPLGGLPHPAGQVSGGDDHRSARQGSRCGERVRPRHRHPLRQSGAGGAGAVRGWV